MPNLDLKKKIMRRVYTIWFFRKITSPLVLETFVLVVIFSVTISHVSLFDVMRNAFNSSSSLFSLSKFFLNNFFLADLISQILTLGAMSLFLIFVWEIFRKRGISILKPTS